jgi:predicted TIM-barrel fold metal-dependent hydrolase
MIVDCHTQIWDSAVSSQLFGAAPAVCADSLHHFEAVHPVDRAIVLAFKSRHLQAEIPNRMVADYVRKHPKKMVGFAGIDPTDPDWRAELQAATEELGLKGVTISPAMQNFHPNDTRAMDLYDSCARLGLPLLFDSHHRSPAAILPFAKPVLIDEVAREFPELKIVIAHLGHPWVDETLVLLAKHRNLFANVAGLLRRPWLAYNALLGAYEFGVIDKLLFGSDFPYRAPAACIEALYSVNHFSHNSGLAAIPREQLRGIVERDALKLLGIERGAAAPALSRPRTVIFDEPE